MTTPLHYRTGGVSKRLSVRGIEHHYLCRNVKIVRYTTEIYEELHFIKI